MFVGRIIAQSETVSVRVGVERYAVPTSKPAPMIRYFSTADSEETNSRTATGAQKQAARIAVNIINRMTELGMPESKVIVAIVMWLRPQVCGTYSDLA